MPKPERRLAAIMFTDMVGYTSLSQTNEPLALKLLGKHREIIRPLLSKHGGREVKTIGDAFLVEFGSALEAATCAIEMQRALSRYNAGERDKILVKVGIHVGDVVHQDGDIYGDTVNIASRVEAQARGGEICISGQVYDQVGNKIDARAERLPVVSMKNVNQRITVYKIFPETKAREAITEPVELEKRRVAVLPLKNLSPNRNDEYFADGLTEELITALSGVSGLTVIARTSVMQYKESTKRISEVGKELRAGTLVEGSVRKAANKLRITIQVVDAESEAHLWVENYDREMDDVFAIQTEIAEKVAGALKVRLVGAERKRLGARPTSSIEAYTLYLKGRYHWNERREASINKAIKYFEEAVAKDPAFALGYAGLADCYLVLHRNLLTRVEGGFRKAREYAQKALSLDDRLVEALAAKALIRLNDDHDFRAAEREFKHAIELNPNYATAHQWYAHLLNQQGRFEEAVAEARKALELDPMSVVISTNYGDGLYYLGDLQGAVKHLKEAARLFPESDLPAASLIQPLCRLGRYDEAMEEVDELAKKGRRAWGKVARAYVLAFYDKEKARQLIEDIDREYTTSVLPLAWLGLACFVLGDADKGFEFYERSFRSQSAFDLSNLKIDYELEPYRADQRYRTLVKRLGIG